MQVSTAEFKKGLKIQFDGAPYTIVDFQHVKPGKGGAFVRTKLKHMRLGRVIDNTFRAGEKVELVDFEEKRMQFLYKDDRYHFMDLDTYDQISLSAEEVGEARDFLKENTEVEILFIEGSPGHGRAAELHRDPDREDRPRHPRRHRFRRLEARHARDRRGDPGAALPERGRCGEGGHAERRLPRPRSDGGLRELASAKRPRRAAAAREPLTPEQVVELAARHNLAELEIEQAGVRIRVVREHAPAAARAALPGRAGERVARGDICRIRTSSRSKRRWSERSIARPPPMPRPSSPKATSSRRARCSASSRR